MTLVRIVPILQRHQHTLEWRQQEQRKDDRRRDPQHQMHIGRRVEQRRDDQRLDDNQRRHEKNHEDRRTVATVGKGEVEPADGANRHDLEIAAKQLALSAARAAAEQTGDEGRRLDQKRSPNKAGRSLPLRPINKLKAD